MSRSETEESASTATWLLRGSMPQEVPVIFASASRVSTTASSWAALRATRRTVAPVARACSSARSVVTVTTSSPVFRSR
ncbi:hypothetical protein SMICM304S_02593 [Streptomyces microflavus]